MAETYTVKRPQTVSRQVNKAKEILGSIWDIEQGRNLLFDQLADVAISIRRAVTNAKGVPDWAGRSPQYREAMKSVFETVIEDPTERLAIRNKMDYHIGNRLRENVEPKELEAAGLQTSSPRERRRERAKELREQAAEVTNGKVIVVPEAFEEVGIITAVEDAAVVITALVDLVLSAEKVRSAKRLAEGISDMILKLHEAEAHLHAIAPVLRNVEVTAVS